MQEGGACTSVCGYVFDACTASEVSRCGIAETAESCSLLVRCCGACSLWLERDMRIVGITGLPEAHRSHRMLRDASIASGAF